MVCTERRFGAHTNHSVIFRVMGAATKVRHSQTPVTQSSYSVFVLGLCCQIARLLDKQWVRLIISSMHYVIKSVFKFIHLLFCLISFFVTRKKKISQRQPPFQPHLAP
jgi:hypothetical protein